MTYRHMKKVNPPPPECWNQTSYKTGCLVSLETAQTLIFISDIQAIGEDCLCYHSQWRSSWLYFLMTFYPDMSQSLHVFCCLIDKVCRAHDSNSEFVNFTSDSLLKSLNLQLWMKRRPRRCKWRLSPVFLELARCSRSPWDFHWNCRVAKTLPSEHLRLYCFIIHKTSWVTARPDGRRKKKMQYFASLLAGLTFNLTAFPIFFNSFDFFTVYGAVKRETKHLCFATNNF